MQHDPKQTKSRPHQKREGVTLRLGPLALGGQATAGTAHQQKVGVRPYVF